MGEYERPAAPPEPRAELAKPDAPAPSIATQVHLMFGSGRRWTQVRVRREGSGFYLDALAEDGRHDHRLTLSGSSLADLEAVVEDLDRALAAFKAKLAETPEAGGVPTRPAGPAPGNPGPPSRTQQQVADVERMNQREPGGQP